MDPEDLIEDPLREEIEEEEREREYKREMKEWLMWKSPDYLLKELLKDEFMPLSVEEICQLARLKTGHKIRPRDVEKVQWNYMRKYHEPLLSPYRGKFVLNRDLLRKYGGNLPGSPPIREGNY